jgi:hypothetical protein
MTAALGDIRLEPTLTSRSATMEFAHCVKCCGTVLEFDIDRAGYTIERCPNRACQDTWRRVRPIAATPTVRASHASNGTIDRVYAVLPAVKTERAPVPAIIALCGENPPTRSQVMTAIAHLVAKRRIGRAKLEIRPENGRYPMAYWRLEAAS